MAVNLYGDINPETAGFVAKQFLERAIPYQVFDKVMSSKELPTNETKVMKFRRYNALSNTPKTLVEGVTPASEQMTSTDISAVLSQYYGGTSFSDVILDTHTDPLLQEATKILGEQAAQMLEIMRFNVAKAGTNVLYTNGSSRTTLTTTISTQAQRRVTRALKKQNARMRTSVIRSTAAYGTENVPAAFIAIVHTDLEANIRQMDGFTPIEKYGSLSPWEMEIGKVEDVRYLASTFCTPWADAATGVTASNGGVNGSTGATGQALLSTTGTNPDVYPVLYFGEDAFYGIALRGKNAVTPMVVNPKPSDSDPWAQRAHVTWKTYQTALIANDLWMARLETVVI